jgi:hypothetical protein
LKVLEHSNWDKSLTSLALKKEEDSEFISFHLSLHQQQNYPSNVWLPTLNIGRQYAPTKTELDGDLITAMPENKSKSLEELRFEYQLTNPKSPRTTPIQQPQSSSSSSSSTEMPPFGTTTPTTRAITTTPTVITPGAVLFSPVLPPQPLTSFSFFHQSSTEPITSLPSPSSTNPLLSPLPHYFSPSTHPNSDNGNPLLGPRVGGTNNPLLDTTQTLPNPFG